MFEKKDYLSYLQQLYSFEYDLQKDLLSLMQIIEDAELKNIFEGALKNSRNNIDKLASMQKLIS